jgi:DUF2914 family protein
MRRYWQAVIAASLSVTTIATAQDPQQAGAPKAPMAEVQVGTSVADRALAGAAETFPVSAGKVFCFARVSNVAVDGQIEFVWFKGDAEQARVAQTVKSSPYRTWSSKNLGADAAGDWRCEIVHDGKVIQSARFKVE